MGQAMWRTWLKVDSYLQLSSGGSTWVPGGGGGGDPNENIPWRPSPSNVMHRLNNTNIVINV